MQTFKIWGTTGLLLCGPPEQTKFSLHCIGTGSLQQHTHACLSNRCLVMRGKNYSSGIAETSGICDRTAGMCVQSVTWREALTWAAKALLVP